MDLLLQLSCALFSIAFFGVLITIVHARRRWLVLGKLPHPPSCDTFWGAMEVIKDLNHIAHHLCATGERLNTGIFAIRILHQDMVFVIDPAIVQQALPLPKAQQIYQVFNAITSMDGEHPNILSHLTNDGYWRMVRKGVAPAFSPRNVRAEFPHLLQVVNRLSDVIRLAGPEQTLDIDNLLQRESMDVIGKTGFGVDLGATRVQDGTEFDDIFLHFKGAALEVVKRWNIPFRHRLRHILPSARRGTAHYVAIQKRMSELLIEVRSKGTFPSEEDQSIAAHLLRLHDPANPGVPLLSDAQLAGEFGLFFFAGFETTGHTMAWTLYLLCRHPAILSRVETELDTAGMLVTRERPIPRELVYTDLSSLEYLGRVIKESMRMIPVVSVGTARENPTEMTLGGYSIPPGTQIILQIYGLHNSNRNWERPEVFNPDRWLQAGVEYARGNALDMPGTSDGGDEVKDTLLKAMDEEGMEREHQARRFLPFSGGSRACVGQNLAAMNYTATLAVLISRFKFQIPPEVDFTFYLLLNSLNCDAHFCPMKLRQLCFPPAAGQRSGSMEAAKESGDESARVAGGWLRIAYAMYF